jgi:CRP-like cAMP-binding protein
MTGCHLRPANGLLSRLTPADFARLEPLLRPTHLLQGQMLLQAGDPIHDVWFPTSAVVSCSAMTDRGSIEVGVAGPEGAVGAAVALGRLVSPHCTRVLLRGDALRLNAQEFRRWFKACPELHECVLSYIHAQLSQATQSVACSRFHDAEQRLARWLLETADRAHVQSFPLTQEFLAVLLGMQRPWLTQTAQRLQDRGLIRCQRGDIEIINRAALEAVVCECYAMVRQHFETFLDRCCPDRNGRDSD